MSGDTGGSALGGVGVGREVLDSGLLLGIEQKEICDDGRREEDRIDGWEGDEEDRNDSGEGTFEWNGCSSPWVLGARESWERSKVRLLI